MFRNSKHYLESLPSVVNVTIPSSPQLFQLDNLDNNSKEEVDPEQAHDQEKENEAPVISSSSQHHATIVGDIHGRFHSLMHIFQMNGFPSPTNPYILVGDLVDKGQSSIQVLLTVIMIQLSCPQCIHFVRGNHEVQSMYRKNMEKNIKAMYNGERKNEVTTLQEQELYSLIVDTIQEIPLAVALQGSCHGKYDDAVRSNNAFIMHGGLVGYDLTIDHIAKIKRGRDPEYDSFFQNLIWAHPQPEIGLTINEHWSSFGPDVTGSFIRRNGLSLLIRGHTYEQEGYSVQHDDKVITLHSAPAIGKEDGHKGAVLNLNACFDRDFFQFGSPPHRLIGDFTPFLDFDVNRGGNDDKQKMQ
jgi:serine/threonine-protein phosphatase 5